VRKMSGLKYSQVQIEAERKAKKEALSRITSLCNSIKVLRERAKALIKEIPEGVRGSFPEEMKIVEVWLKESLPQYSEDMNSTELNSIAEKLKEIEAKGKEALKRLIEIKEVKRGEKAKALLSTIEILSGELKSLEDLMNKWKPGESEKFRQRLKPLPQMIEAGEFVEVERKLKDLETELNNLRQELTTLQAQDEQRWYVLEALRKVCKDELGWGEEREPALEDETNPASSIIYEVDTYYGGKIIFYLRLEDIKVNSEIPTEGGVCYREFDNLSEKLKKFGVITKFEPETISDEPELLRKGEMDLPDEGIEKTEEV